MKRYLLVLTMLVLLFLSACLPQPADAQDQVETPPVESPPTVGPHTQVSFEAQSPIDLAKNDLAERLGISEKQIEVVDVAKTTWPDASLGCPKLGVLYIQVVTDGYRILLDANGTIYEYHTDTGEQVLLCENLEFPIIPVTPGEINDGQPWMPN